MTLYKRRTLEKRFTGGIATLVLTLYKTCTSPVKDTDAYTPALPDCLKITFNGSATSEMGARNQEMREYSDPVVVNRTVNI